jgi:hypothetical protein
VTLTRSRRLRPDEQDTRLALLVRQSVGEAG